MGVNINIDVHIDVNKIASQFESLKDDTSMYKVHDMFAQLCDPYVPMDEGVLAHTLLHIAKDKIVYDGPYAHYQYMGEVYGPNIPEIEDGIIVGWWSPPGKGSKHPTGRPIQYNTEKHMLASKEWDKAMMRDRGDEFKQKVAEILLKRCKELYG